MLSWFSSISSMGIVSQGRRQNQIFGEFNTQIWGKPTAFYLKPSCFPGCWPLGGRAQVEYLKMGILKTAPAIEV